MVTAAQLNKGDQAIIEAIDPSDVYLKLLDMGCLPGEKIRILNIAPLGDPIIMEVGGYTLSLRKSEAAAIRVKVTT